MQCQNSELLLSLQALCCNLCCNVHIPLIKNWQFKYVCFLSSIDYVDMSHFLKLKCDSAGLTADSLALKLQLMVPYKETGSERRGVTERMHWSLFSDDFFFSSSANNRSVSCFTVCSDMKRHANRWLCCRHFPFIFCIDFLRRWSTNRKVLPVVLEGRPKGQWQIEKTLDL